MVMSFHAALPNGAYASERTCLSRAKDTLRRFGGAFAANIAPRNSLAV
jgi:hypothetical protein